jgi:hypothetical protein
MMASCAGILMIPSLAPSRLLQLAIALPVGIAVYLVTARLLGLSEPFELMHARREAPIPLASDQ